MYSYRTRIRSDRPHRGSFRVRFGRDRVHADRFRLRSPANVFTSCDSPSASPEQDLARSSPPSSSSALDIYDPATNTWTSGAPLPSEHSGGVGVVLAGQFYVIGGSTGEVVAYNPNTNRWLKKASFPVPNARFMSGDKVTLDGKARIVVHSGTGAADDGRPTYVYTPGAVAFCHPERSEGGHIEHGPLRCAQGDTVPLFIS
jgi:hypothetical protein